MQFDRFKRIVTCFADHAGGVDIEKGELVMELRNDMIKANLEELPNGLFVEENGSQMPAARWIVTRLARLDALADRICDYVTPPEHFVPPSGTLQSGFNESANQDETLKENVVDTMIKTLGRRRGGETSLLYLTSDAGEGKTSLIDYTAVRQAENYKEKKTDWLLVPVPLGGRTFLRFDDVVISSLVNRLRFQLLYYDAFLELVQLGVIVPAFDGFEEMIVEGSSGEAISALGQLIRKLRSSGRILVAARKAFFDYPTFSTQARLFDTVGSEADVSFGRLSIDRWKRKTFELYARKRGVSNPRQLYSHVASRLGDENHPVLTRAVLVRRLIDVANDAEDLLKSIGTEQRDYFHDFVGGIVEREARIKWPDKSGASSGSILSTDEHHQLLSMIAQEMWLSDTDELGEDLVALVVDMFADEGGKSPALVRQVKERIKQHSLLAVKRPATRTVKFDHDDFRIFYLGQALGRALAESSMDAVELVIDRAALPERAIAESAGYIRRNHAGFPKRTLAMLQKLADEAVPTSFSRENCGLLALALIDGGSDKCEIKNMSFPINAVRGRHLSNVRFSGSYFSATEMTDSMLHRCQFLDCQFERMEIDGSQKISDSRFDDACKIESVVFVKSDSEDRTQYFEPEQVRHRLCDIGFTISCKNPSPSDKEENEFADRDLALVQRFLRGFLRGNPLNEQTIRTRLGKHSNYFMKALLPQLKNAGLVKEVQYQGHGTHRRIRLVAQMKRIDEAIKGAEGEFGSFIECIQRETA